MAKSTEDEEHAQKVKSMQTQIMSMKKKNSDLSTEVKKKEDRIDELVKQIEAKE